MIVKSKRRSTFWKQIVTVRLWLIAKRTNLYSFEPHKLQSKQAKSGLGLTILSIVSDNTFHLNKQENWNIWAFYNWGATTTYDWLISNTTWIWKTSTCPIIDYVRAWDCTAMPVVTWICNSFQTFQGHEIQFHIKTNVWYFLHICTTSNNLQILCSDTDDTAHRLCDEVCIDSPWSWPPVDFFQWWEYDTHSARWTEMKIRDKTNLAQ
jgi:hypothetical protein